MDAELDGFLTDAATRGSEDLVALPIRELIDKWRAKRRGYQVVERIQQDLAAKGLTTEPSFTRGWIDSEVRLVPRHLKKPLNLASSGESPDDEVAEQDNAQEVGLLVSSLPSADREVMSIPPQTDLLKVQSLMIRHDYSQLAVRSGERDLVGAVSWESIAVARLTRGSIDLSDCTFPAETVSLEDEILPLIPKVNESGFVFVLAHDKKISGIVTPSDIMSEFGQLARPFFLVGEVERRLRAAIDQRFKPIDLSDAVDPTDRDRMIESADDLTIGEYKRLLENPDHWKRTDWAADRNSFIEALDEIRVIRNEIMHFSPDPLEEEQINKLRLFIRWLRILT